MILGYLIVLEITCLFIGVHLISSSCEKDIDKDRLLSSSIKTERELQEEAYIKAYLPEVETYLEQSGGREI